MGKLKEFNINYALHSTKSIFLKEILLEGKLLSNKDRFDKKINHKGHGSYGCKIAKPNKDRSKRNKK